MQGLQANWATDGFFGLAFRFERGGELSRKNALASDTFQRVGGFMADRVSLSVVSVAVPGVMRFAVLANTKDPNAEHSIKELQAAASAIGRPIETFGAISNREDRRCQSCAKAAGYSLGRLPRLAPQPPGTNRNGPRDQPAREAQSRQPQGWPDTANHSCHCATRTNRESADGD
jgi:hypothetical protein